MPLDYSGMNIIVFDGGQNQALEDLIKQYNGNPVVASASEDQSFSRALDALTGGTVDIVLFTDPQQINPLFKFSCSLDKLDDLMDSLRQIAIGSLGPACTEALQTFDIRPDFESDQMEIDDLVKTMSRLSDYLVMKKRSAVDAGIETTSWRRVDMVWPMAEEHHNLYKESEFLKACRREPTNHTPIWLMRQAGRYQREFRDVRAKVEMLDLCKTPDLAAEVTLMATERLGVDAAIIFSDILPILQPFGLDLEYVKGTGPVIHNPIRSATAVDQMPEVEPEAMSHVYEAIRLTRRALQPTIPLIGFAGAPFTMAAYAIEGGGSKQYQHTKKFMYDDPGAWHALLEKISRATVAYLNEQIAAGAQAVQLFDSWVGCLSPDDYREFVQPHSGYIFAHLTPDVPAVHFGTATSTLLGLMQEAGGNVIGLDWRVDLAEAWGRLGHDTVIQGNLDPLILFASPKEIEKRAKAILHKVKGRPGYIFNLGHGILPGTPEDNVTALIDVVHEYGN